MPVIARGYRRPDNTVAGDTIHPNQDGQKLIAGIIKKYLQPTTAAAVTKVTSLGEKILATLKSSGMSAAVATDFLGGSDVKIEPNPKTPEAAYNGAMSLIAKAVTGKLTPVEAAKLADSAVYTKALYLIEVAKKVASQLDEKGLSYKFLKAFNPEFADSLDANKSPAIQKAWLVFYDPNLLQPMLAIAQPTDPAVDAMEAPIALSGQTKTTIKQVVAAVRTGQDLKLVGTLSKELLVDIVRSIGAYAQYTKSKNGDVSFNPAELKTAAAKGAPGAAHLLGYIDIIRDYKNASTFLKTVLQMSNPIAAVEPSAQDLKSLTADWIAEFGDESALRPLKAIDWLQKTFSALREEGTTLEGILYFLKSNGNSDPSAIFLSQNATFLKSLFSINPQEGGQTTISDNEVDLWMGTFIARARTILTDLAQVRSGDARQSLIKDMGFKDDPRYHMERGTASQVRGGWAASALWLPVISGLNGAGDAPTVRIPKMPKMPKGIPVEDQAALIARSAGSKRIGWSKDIKVDRIKEYVGSGEEFNSVLSVALKSLTYQPLQGALDLGFTGAFRGKPDGLFNTEDIYAYAMTQIGFLTGTGDDTFRAEAASKGLTDFLPPVAQSATTSLTEALGELNQRGIHEIATSTTVTDQQKKELFEKIKGQGDKDTDLTTIRPDEMPVFAALMEDAQHAQAVVMTAVMQYDLAKERVKDVANIINILKTSKYYSYFLSNDLAKKMRDLVAAEPAIHAEVADKAESIVSLSNVQAVANKFKTGDEPA